MTQKRRVAEEIYTLYRDSIRSAFPRRKATTAPSKVQCEKCGDYFFTHSSGRACDRCKTRQSTKTGAFDDLRKSDRRPFLAAARMCIEMDADPREYVMAQFAMWREASAYHQKLLWPMPQHMGTLAAQVRYLQFKAREEVRISRVSDVEDQDDSRRWFVEERKLKGLARVQRRDPTEVLTEQPEEFSRDFLKYKGVWSVVSDLWEERQRS